MIVCAAIRIARPEDKYGDLVICGYRHCDCYELLYRLNYELSLEARRKGLITEGFLATGNRFMNREEAYAHANECGQTSAQARHDKAERRESELFSEDLY